MKVFVSGGMGFLAGHLIDRLIEEGHEVQTADWPIPGLELWWDKGVATVAGDLRNAMLVEKMCRGMDVVFHVAALAAPWGKKSSFWSNNVDVTDNIISACKQKGVKRLVHVSSPSAVFDGSDHIDADESLPYPTQFLSHYCETKAVSEQRVLAANGPDLETTALRPHVIWGPGDHHLVPRLLERAQAGRLARIGDGKNRISTLYVENGVDALMAAATAPAAPGNAYFITNDQPVLCWEFIDRVLGRLGVDPPTKRVSKRTAWALASIMESTWRLLPLKGEPPLTRYAVAELTANHTYSIEKAKRDLGYAPRVSVEEGLDRYVEWFNSEENEA